MNSHLVLGGPGCGKTTRLLDIVAEEVSSGTSPNKIAFVAFTKAAAEEAKARAVTSLQLDLKQDLPWFRTIHSLAYGQVGVIRDEVLGKSDWAEFSKVVGMNVTGKRWFDDVGKAGDQYVHIVDYARTTEQELSIAWEQVGQGTNWYALERFALALKQFKQDKGKMDFTDMLTEFVRICDPIDVDVAIIDEAQDLTPLQWRVVNHAFRNVQRLYIAGDDDQAIYQWAGADIEKFLSLDAKREILPKSHRLPGVIHRLTRDIASRISQRYQKNFSAAEEKSGEILWYQRPQQVNLSAYKGNWLILGRNHYILYELERWVRRLGLLYQMRLANSIKPAHIEAIYGWEDWRKGEAITAQQAKGVLKFYKSGSLIQRLDPAKEYKAKDLGIHAIPYWHEILTGIPERDRWYYMACMRRKQSLKREPRFRLDTIHGVKGAEADHVLLMTDMSARTLREFQVQPDPEHRVFYVAASRARESLHIIAPQGPNYYSI